MFLKKNNFWTAFFLAVISFSCTKYSEFKNETEYLKFISNPENGFIKIKEINGLKTTVKLLPPDYLAYKELGGKVQSEKEKDSLVSLYKNCITFLMTISPQGKDNSDLMYLNLGSYEEYKERVLSMNFNMEEFISLKTGGKTYKPVLSTLENTYGLGKQRSVYIVFADKELINASQSSKNIDFEFVDEFFNTGISHFVFENSVVLNSPSIQFWTYDN